MEQLDKHRFVADSLDEFGRKLAYMLTVCQNRLHRLGSDNPELVDSIVRNGGIARNKSWGVESGDAVEGMAMGIADKIKEYFKDEAEGFSREFVLPDDAGGNEPAAKTESYNEDYEGYVKAGYITPITENNMKTNKKLYKDAVKLGVHMMYLADHFHVWHINADTKAEHLHLEAIYETLRDKADSILECSVGRLDEPIDVKGSVDFPDMPYKFGRNTVLDALYAIAQKVIDLAEECGDNDTGLENILGDLAEKLDSLIYKFRRLR